jgi:hypothetical protein
MILTLREASGFAGDLELVDGCSQSNIEPAEEPLLPEEMERKRPRLAEPHGRLPSHFAQRQLHGRLPRTCDEAANSKALLGLRGTKTRSAV